MICFLRASTVQYDVRLHKYIEACKCTSTPYLAFTWDRVLNCTRVENNEYQYKRYSPYGRKWRNLLNLILWQFHLIFSLIKFRKRYKVIHACNIDTVFPALIMKIFRKRVVFDIYDSVVIPVERKLSKHFIDILILPNVRRLAQIGLKSTEVKQFLEVENVPSFSNSKRIHRNIVLENPIKLSYVGVFERNIRGLENLIDEVVNNGHLVLNIAGIGAGMEKLVQDAANSTDRIKYYGSVDYDKALQIMADSDFIIAMYYLSNPLHKYASPNKFYESLYLGIPIVTTRHTLVGDMATDCNSGYAIGESKDDLHSFFESVQSEVFINSYNQKCMDAYNLWSAKFADYFSKKLCGEYIQTLCK